MKDKLTFAAGIINILMGAGTFVYAILMALFAFVSLILVFTIFIVAALPVFLIMLFITCITFAAAIANTVVGVGTLVSSIKGGNVSKAFSIVSVTVDGVFIPANGIFMLISLYLVATPDNMSWLSVLLAVLSTVVFLLAVASLVLHIVRLVRYGRQAKSGQI